MKPRVWRTLAGGLSCVSLTVIGQALSHDATAVAAATAGGVVAGPVGAAVGGLAVKALGNFLGDSGGDLIMEGGREALSAWLGRGGGQKGKLPLNHDLARAIRLSQLDALDFIVTLHAEAQDGRRFARRVREWTDASRREAAAPDFLDAPEDQAVLSDLAATLEDIAGRAASEARLARSVEDAMFAELQAASQSRGWPIDGIEDFEIRFRGGAGQTGWLGATNAFFAARLKDEKAVALRAAFELDQFRGLNLRLETLRHALEVSGTAITDRLGAIEEALRDLGAASGGGDTLDPNRLAARGGSVAEIISELRRVLTTGARWSRTAAGVRQRQARLLARPMFGREPAMARLDAFLSDRTSGLLIVTGSAGAGKSSLIAHWLENAAPTNTARHFISADLPVTTDPAGIEGHLAAQLRALLDPSDAPSTADQPAGEQIHEMLQAFVPAEAGDRVIIVLDGLDEAAGRFEPFIPDILPEGVFVVLSCRADSAADAPPALRPWLNLLDRAPGTGGRLHLEGLDQHGLRQWLNALDPALSGPDQARLSANLLRSLDGVPLFVSEVLQTLLSADGSPPAGDLPFSFSDYVRERLDELEQAGDAWALASRRLFALLGIARGPLRQWEIEEIFTHMPGTPAVELTSLDNRIARWFVIRRQGSERLFAFHHPRLASAFSEQLGADARTASDALACWLADGWRSRSRRDGAPYALDWAPEQLRDLGDAANSVRLLTDADFLSARLSDHAGAPERLQRTIEDWRRITVAGQEGAGRDHAAFWALHGDRLLRAWRPRPAARTSYAEVVLNVLADAGLIEGRTGRATVAHPPAPSVLIRAASHPGLLVATGGHGLVMSACRFGRVRFWDSTGRPRGDPDDAIRHTDEVHWLAALNDGFVSAGEDGRVLFWTADGESRCTALPPPVHIDGPLGVTPLTNGGAVTHDVEGLVVFWGPDGGERARESFGRPVRQALSAHGRVFLTCDDGRCAIRDEVGGALAGQPSAVHPHPPGVASCATTPEGFVSWSFNGAPVFWTRDGAPLAPLDPVGDGSGFFEILADARGVVGRTDRETIQFWTPAGERVAHDEVGSERFGKLCRNDHRILAVASSGCAMVWDWRGRLIGRTADLGLENSAAVWAVTGGWLVAGLWGGASAFISTEGALLATPDVCPRVTACLVRPRLTVTGDMEGRVRFWSTDGALLSHPFPPELHASGDYGVRELFEVEDVLVSYGRDGVLKFWNVGALDGRFDLVEPDRVEGATGTGAVGADRAVSWDYYGRLLFWDDDGRLIRDIALSAESAVSDAVWVDRAVVVCERDNAFHIFTPDGDRLLENRSLAGGGRHLDVRLTRFPGGCAVTDTQTVTLIDNDGMLKAQYDDLWADQTPIHEVVAVDEGVVVVSRRGRPALCRFSGVGAGPSDESRQEGFYHLARSGDAFAVSLDTRFDLWDPCDLEQGFRARRTTTSAIVDMAGLDSGFATFESLGWISFWSADGTMLARDPRLVSSGQMAMWRTAPDRLYVADHNGGLAAWTGQGRRLFEHASDVQFLKLAPISGGVMAADFASRLFWFSEGPNGTEATVKSCTPHAGDVGLESLADGRTLSWASDDVIHIWSGPDELDDTIVLPDSIREVRCVDDGLFVFGSRIWRLRWPLLERPSLARADVPAW